MERTGRIGIGSFVMRGHEYLVAIVPDHGVLRADTLRYADEIRKPDAIGLPKRTKAAAKKVDQFVKEIDELTRDELDVSELEDQEAAALQELVKSKQKDKDNVIHETGLEEEDSEAPAGGGAKIIDLMEVLRKSLSKNAVVTNAQGGPPISLAERREARAAAKAPAKKATKKKTTTQRKTAKNKAKRA
jgi:DNA end-binding protein Ku